MSEIELVDPASAPRIAAPRRGMIALGAAMIGLAVLGVATASMLPHATADTPAPPTPPVAPPPVTPVRPAPMPPPVIRVHVDTSPPGAAVHVAGDPHCFAPCEVELERDPRPIEIAVERTGFVRQVHTIVPDVDHRLVVQLVAAPRRGSARSQGSVRSQGPARIQGPARTVRPRAAGSPVGAPGL